VSEAVIDVSGLAKTFRAGVRMRRVHAVRNISFRVPRGAIVAIVGPNGAGKTTTIHTALGFTRPTSGSVRVFGETPGPSALRRIGYQPEIFPPYAFQTAKQALRFYGKLSGTSEQILAVNVPRLLERLGLSDAADRPIGAFSKGMTQRLGLAQALVHDPELLILDEPTSGLDPQGRRLVLDIVREEKAAGRTICLSSHILADVERTCDEVIMVHNGEVAFTDRLSAFAADGQEWAIEVAGWSAGSAALLAGCVFTVGSQVDAIATLRCATADKRQLLHALTALPLDVVSVQSARATLEDRYLSHVGRA
jgi:ABC-2 type transport system ATP-binding protein